MPIPHSPSKKPRTLMAALALGTALGAVGGGWIMTSQPSTAATAAPLSCGAR